MHPKSWFASMLSLFIAFVAIAAAHAQGTEYNEAGYNETYETDQKMTLARESVVGFFNENYLLTYSGVAMRARQNFYAPIIDRLSLAGVSGFTVSKGTSGAGSVPDLWVKFQNQDPSRSGTTVVFYMFKGCIERDERSGAEKFSVCKIERVGSFGKDLRSAQLYPLPSRSLVEGAMAQQDPRTFDQKGQRKWEYNANNVEKLKIFWNSLRRPTPSVPAPEAVNASAAVATPPATTRQE